MRQEAIGIEPLPAARLATRRRPGGDPGGQTDDHAGRALASPWVWPNLALGVRPRCFRPSREELAWEPLGKPRGVQNLRRISFRSVSSSSNLVLSTQVYHELLACRMRTSMPQRRQLLPWLLLALRTARCIAKLSPFARRPVDGLCGPADAGSNWCLRGLRGGWRLNNASATNWTTAARVCVKYCRSCTRCNYVSISVEKQLCLWYSSCDLDGLDQRGHAATFGTLPVRTVPSQLDRRKRRTNVALNETLGGCTARSTESSLPSKPRRRRASNGATQRTAWNENSSQSSCRPSLFVYSLPDSYRQGGLVGETTDFAGNAEAMAHRGLGPRIKCTQKTFPGLDCDAVALHASYESEIADLFYQRAMGYRCLTRDVTSADLFLVPAFRRGLPTDPLLCAEQGYRGAPSSTGALFTRLALQHGGRLPCNSDGTDHLLMFTVPGLEFETREQLCEFDPWDWRWGRPTRFALEEGGNYSYPPLALSRVDHRLVAPKKDARSVSGLSSVPYSSSVHLGARARAPLPWQTSRPRDRLVAVVLGKRYSNSLAGTQQLRERLGKSCRKATGVCAFLDLTDAPKTGLGGSSSEESMQAALEMYWRATFCLQPGGDTVARKGIVDALLMGCIPVLFHHGQRLMWPWHWGSWVENATVLIQDLKVIMGQVDVVSELQAIPVARIEHMQATLAQHAHRMHYSAIDTAQLPATLGSDRTDAFDVALEGAWRRSSRYREDVYYS